MSSCICFANKIAENTLDDYHCFRHSAWDGFAGGDHLHSVESANDSKHKDRCSIWVCFSITVRVSQYDKDQWLTISRLIALAALHLHYIVIGIDSHNQTFDQITPSIIEQVQLSWSLIAATIPCLKAFIATLGSGYLGGQLGRNYATGQGYSGQDHSNQSESYAMKTMDTMGQSMRVKNKVVGGKSDTLDATSTRTLTRQSREMDGNTIQMTRGYDIRYD